ncbi:phage replication protein O [Paenibacillus sp. UNCCL117]|uniref:replication protein n=1 Tax=unclassified Paenibacillus TaxID=185978 RepID=UPI00087ECFD6|nr:MULTISPECIES: replication protein [unclassified Paenibacillus]SDC69241.1 Bacteriophage replication protein O [Paenibacillus sp. cl123]SFW23860.1 phage replication protein O [Paenibacillus sp. UNCCL117]
MNTGVVNPQKERGYVGLANDIWDEIIRRDFTKRQKDILQFIIRMSYGCGRKTAFIPKQKDFSLCGVGENKIKSELEYLENCKVIRWDRVGNEYGLNKDYDAWQVSPVRSWDEDRYKEIIHTNITLAKKERKKVTETGSFSQGNQSEESSQNGNFEEIDEEAAEVEELPETGRSDENNFPKREEELPEKGSSTPDLPSNDAASEASKKGLKKKDIKKDLKDYAPDDATHKKEYSPYVFLTDDEHQKLSALLGDELEDYFLRFGSWISGQTARVQQQRSAYLSIRNWHREDQKKKTQRFQKKSTFDQDRFLNSLKEDG